MKKTFGFSLTAVSLLFACSSAQKSKDQFATVKAPSGGTPACLNVQEGDRHVEFAGQDLFLSEEGKPKPLELNNGDDVICEKLEIIRFAKHPSVFIRFHTREAGTSVGISDTKIAIASIKDATWVLKPTLLERHFHRGDTVEVDQQRTYVWQPMTEDKQPVLVITESGRGPKLFIYP